MVLPLPLRRLKHRLAYSFKADKLLPCPPSPSLAAVAASINTIPCISYPLTMSDSSAESVADIPPSLPSPTSIAGR